MYLLKKTLSAIVDLELENHRNINEFDRRGAVEYSINALTLMPWFFRYPLSLITIFINLFSLFLNRSMFFKMSVNDRAMLWNKLAGYPGFQSLKKLIRTLTLMSAYGQYDKRN